MTQTFELQKLVNEIVACYLSGIAISKIASICKIEDFKVIDILASEAIKLKITDQEFLDLGKVLCNECKTWCEVSELHGNPIYIRNTLCKKCRYAKDLARKFGLSTSEILQVLNRGNVCEICGASKKLVVDHDHSTGKIRGLLCSKCNTGIGLLKDNPKLLLKAADYIGGKQ